MPSTVLIKLSRMGFNGGHSSTYQRLVKIVSARDQGPRGRSPRGNVRQHRTFSIASAQKCIVKEKVTEHK